MNIDIQEKVRCRKAVDEALVNLSLENLQVSPSCMELYEQYVRGEISTTNELIELVKEVTADELKRSKVG